MKQDLYFQALSSLSQALCIIDEDYRIVYANKKFEQIPAFSENIKGMFFWQVFPMVDKNKLIKFTKDLSTQEEPRSLNGCHHEGMDGTSSWWDIGFQSITTTYCKNYFMITMNNVTDKYNPNQKQVEGPDDFEHIIQSIRDPLVVFNQDMEGIFANKAFHALMEVELPYPHKIKDWNAIYEYLDFNGKQLHPDELPIQNSLQGESVHNLELQLFHIQNQTKKFYYISTYPINIEGIDEKHFVLVMRDVTKDLGQEKSRKDFIQIAAHELRTPLTAIKGFTQLVLERYKERQKKWFFQPTIQLIKEIDRDQTFFKVILDEAIRLDQLTNELLSIFKIDQGKFEMSIENIRLSQITKEVIEEFVIPDDFHHLHYIEEALQTSVKVDIKQVKRVIHNLLSNAVKYSPNHPDIYVFLEEKDNRIRLSVKDEGIGIPEDQQDRIFERFFRAYSPTHEEIHGYGVGLHICQEIMQQHESEICFKSTYGVGSTFYFELPIE